MGDSLLRKPYQGGFMKRHHPEGNKKEVPSLSNIEAAL